MSVIIRTERPDEYRKTEELTRAAFWNHYAPGGDEHYLVHVLRSAPEFVPELCLVAEDGGELVGQILYTKAKIFLDKGGEETVLTFGPISVHPSRQGQGIGRKLVETSAALAKDLGYGAILLYGDPAVYSHMGFSPAENYSIGSHDNFYADALQALELTPGFLSEKAGRFYEAPAFSIDPAAVEAYDAAFPKLEKITGGPVQERFLYLGSQRRPR